MRDLYGNSYRSKGVAPAQDGINLKDPTQDLNALKYDGLSPEDLAHGKLLFTWLTDVERVIVVLKAVFGFNTHEVAFVLGTSESNIHHILDKARGRRGRRKNPFPVPDKTPRSTKSGSDSEDDK